jgi:segregation and condensation protein B
MLREEFHRLRDRLHGSQRQARLSQTAIDVLAIVAYNEPLSGDDVARLRGMPSGGVLAQLVRRQLLRLHRPDEEPRKPLYYTTPRFLKLFGLESLSDLPQSQELDQR